MWVKHRASWCHQQEWLDRDKFRILSKRNSVKRKHLTGSHRKHLTGASREADPSSTHSVAGLFGLKSLFGSAPVQSRKERSKGYAEE